MCPSSGASWSPDNFDRTFSGEVSATEALRRSLNVPAILVAEGVGLEQAVGTMEACGVRFAADAARRGGLSVAVGGVEVRLLDLTAAYATIGRGGIYRPAKLVPAGDALPVRVLAPETCAAIDDILSSRHRRPHGMEERLPSSVPWFMWKTGTSSHRRDAWALGHNGRYAIGVWAGRFAGGRDDRLLGAHTAEPLLAKLFDLPALRATTTLPRRRPGRSPARCRRRANWPDRCASSPPATAPASAPSTARPSSDPGPTAPQESPGSSTAPFSTRRNHSDSCSLPADIVFVAPTPADRRRSCGLT